MFNSMITFSGQESSVALPGPLGPNFELESRGLACRRVFALLTDILQISSCFSLLVPSTCLSVPG